MRQETAVTWVMRAANFKHLNHVVITCSYQEITSSNDVTAGAFLTVGPADLSSSEEVVLNHGFTQVLSSDLSTSVTLLLYSL